MLGARTIRLQQLYQLLSLLCVFSNLGNLLFAQANPNDMKRLHSGTLLVQGTGVQLGSKTWPFCSGFGGLIAVRATESMGLRK